MATTPRPFLASAPATKLVRVANTTLFHLAATYLGNALFWTIIAQANGLTDPWINGQANIVIPDLPPQSGTPAGILGL